tara:strand:+ start:1249 stop:1671 length:423 start_codon:yes stop_codon:yes gene_type:complete
VLRERVLKTWVVVIALLAVVPTALPGTPSAQRGQEALESTTEGLLEGLRPSKGREVVLENCVLCHSTAIILSSHMSRNRWDEVITWMQDEHDLWPLETVDRALILDYLETTQGELAFNDDQLTLKSSPWAWPFYRPNPIW